MAYWLVAQTGNDVAEFLFLPCRTIPWSFTPWDELPKETQQCASSGGYQRLNAFHFGEIYIAQRRTEGYSKEAAVGS
uniref:Uncharacterized protein n=1 Tax=Oryza brachyantha TaxID=4533 RepID=J3KUM3_ORYBR